jgi:hypothetical protein
VVGSSPLSAEGAGHSTLSAPGSLRTFFQSARCSSPAGRPEMTTVRTASGSCAELARAGRGAAFGFFGALVGGATAGADDSPASLSLRFCIYALVEFHEEQ